MRERNIVIIAGSGRSGTTWLGSILDTYDGCDYYYEIDAFKNLSFNNPHLRRIKYPFTHWLKSPPLPIQRLEQALLVELQKRRLFKSSVDKALRIRNRYRYKSGAKETNLFKIVRLFSFALQCEELSSRYGPKLKIVHIIRNPFGQLASQHKMISANRERPQRPFQKAIDIIMSDDRLTQYRELARQHTNASWMEKSALIWWAGNEVLMNAQNVAKMTVLFETLVRHPYQETERLFEFLGWPLSEQTYDHIANTTNPTIADNEKHSIQKDADAVLNKWRKHISGTDYRNVSRLLEDCRLMELWDKEDLTDRRLQSQANFRSSETQQNI